MALLVLGSIVIGLSVGLEKSRGNFDDMRNLDVWTKTENEVRAKDALEKYFPFENIESLLGGNAEPGQAAHHWLIDNNILADLPDFRIIQRFFMATFFYSTGEPSTWENKTGWLSEVNECDW